MVPSGEGFPLVPLTVLNGDLEARSGTAALTEAAALVDEEMNASAVGRDEAPFRRQE